MTFQVFTEFEQQERFSPSMGVLCVHFREAVIIYSCKHWADEAVSAQADGVDCFPRKLLGRARGPSLQGVVGRDVAFPSSARGLPLMGRCCWNDSPL